ncbi:hypothetical protein BDZ94DRAFT_1294288 [Collybia nuda]|uniref:RING-type domain-containing protein n=1 Tax=Collybia nuda TaxID=64659 RepID=A0A9P6CQK7_9AGAR|nr:hypothetical protein BDZ94DRAFT_1294288 [Collybia nuda]
MGQNSSRHHQSPPPTLVAAPSNFGDNSPTDPSANPLPSDSTVLNVTPSSGSRRTSVRKSILNLVKPSARSHADSSTNNKRKSWRSSKRWSKAPPDLSEVSESTSSSSAGPSTVPTTPTSGKEPDIEQNVVSDASEQLISAGDRPSTPFPPMLTELPPDSAEGGSRIDHEVGQNIGTWLSAQDVQQTSTPTFSEGRDVVIGPNDSLSPDENTPPVQPESTPEPQPEEPTGNRQFPPPGTLVVVQGVVHTTDVPRNPPSTTISDSPEPVLRSSSTPPNAPGSTRNRLSALLRSRPTSMVLPQVPSAPSASSTTTDLIADSVAPPENTQPVSSIHSQSHIDLAHPDTPTSPMEVIPPREPEARGGTISSSSIDVLGTLLSVAAAATAASLLTGSSEPILSSGLSPPYSPNDPASNQTQPLNGVGEPPRPASPTPTAGFGMGDTTAAGRAERLRHAWGSIRERLGLRPAPQSEDNPPSNTATTTSSGSTDPRELMLAQMARAFNLGFGLNGEGQAAGAVGRPQADTNGTVASEPNAEESRVISDSPQLPPEGSFERFLVDLQVDLREALTSPGGLTGDNSNSTNQTSPLAPLITSEASPPTTQPTVEPSSSTVDNNGDAMPMLEPVSDSDSEFSNDHPPRNLERLPGTFPTDPGPSRTHVQSQHVEDANLSTAGVHSAISSDRDNTANRPESRTGGTGRINWWRLYRFPPIMAPRPQGAADTGSSVPVNSTSPSPLGSSVGLPITMDPTLAELPFAPAAETQTPPVHTVIPVIVVGLQSVNTSWQQRGQNDDNESIDMLGDGGDSEAGDDDLNDDGTPNFNNRSGTEGAGRNRGRAWHSRAAEAIRNLRHGRRTRTAPTTTLPGSRTFLIYVIGGYYPPNHSIVTGGPNSLDSFEALLELAELLGQVKPPTVTKEDIDKSGLEIIKAAQVEQYEQDGKISSNCTERCLICLDDYHPEEDVRVMSCRHAFHKACVDKWLETGRNNCPACRSKGVSTDTSFSPTEV